MPLHKLCLLLLFCASLNGLAAQNGEPILGNIQTQVSSLNGETAEGQLQVYQILRLELDNPQAYQVLELEIEPLPPGPSGGSSGGTAPNQPVNLLVYSQVHEAGGSRAQNSRQSTVRTSYKGNRLLTRGIAGRSLVRFSLAKNPETPGGLSGPRGNPYEEAYDGGETYGETYNGSNGTPAYSANYSVRNISLNTGSLPLYVVLHPFQPNAAGLISPDLLGPGFKVPQYRYNVRFIKKDFGSTRFRLIPPQAGRNGKKNWGSNYLDDPNLDLRMQINGQNYRWAFDFGFVPDSGHRQGQRGVYVEPDQARYSKVYEMGLGEHSVQVSSRQHYARAKFRIEAGDNQTIELQLQERLSQLRIVLPKDAVLLVDGIPLQSKRRWAADWQDVEIRELENYNHRLPRLQYSLTVPAGKHHLLVQYEGNTWQQEIYLREGAEQSFRLGWELSAEPGPDAP
ncbi:hypothetical protein P0082_07240 [Candidatus Haliotispira prima]|uniref:Uncharacterized protein n=1 Tax=Candidatus Haliotispira prima TaxID=3034016 RepID=A0ABY8MEK4_9SPIO|nr:hypothetical protein P0082_07240 [Candidatus Haliotispira prima]